MMDIQNAYATLNDAQERAWYDAHREQILRSGDEVVDREEDDIDLYQYMSNKCFEGFEGDSGFFGVYFGVFEKLAADERAAVERRREAGDLTEDENENEEEAAPVFGYHDTRWEYVDGFYKYWSDFECQRQMAWADEHDLQEAPDVGRRVKWEKENRKARREERKKASWHVRELVQFVKRRDPRVAAFLAEQKELKEKNKEGWELRKQEEREAQEAENAQFAAEQAERYKELEEGEDPFARLSEWMLELGFKQKEAQKYASALCEEGHETLQLLAGRVRMTSRGPSIG